MVLNPNSLKESKAESEKINLKENCFLKEITKNKLSSDNEGQKEKIPPPKPLSSKERNEKRKRQIWIGKTSQVYKKFNREVP
ncbi:hypothetical protein MHBO_001745, partial [Bonamia ostreae]